MKKNLSLRYFMIIGCSLMITILNLSNVSAQAFRLNSVSDLKRVFEDGYKMPTIGDTLELFGLRGEILSGQCAVQTKKKLTGVTVNINELADQKNGSKLPPDAVEWNFVGSIPLTQNTPNQPLTAVVRKAPGRFPDYLMAEKQIDINEKLFQGIWITVKIPATAEPGSYNGVITVKSAQGEARLPVALTVYPLTLPEKRNLKVTEWYSTDFSQFYGIKERYSNEWFAMLRKYAENMAAHRQNVFQVPFGSITIAKSDDGLEFDFSRFDQIAQVFWDTKGMDYLETGELARFGDQEWQSTDIHLQKFNVKNLKTGKTDTMEGKDVIPTLLPAFESHLRAKGWLARTYFHIKDEPSVHNSMAWKEISAYMHHYAPDLVRMDAIETTNMIDEIEVAVPKLDAFGTWYDSYHSAQLLKGLELWFYTVGIYQGSLFPNKTIDMPLIDSRIMHWLNYKYDATGYLHWGWNQWTDDPFEEVGMHIGDGWHVYPSKDGVLNSIRWEEMRNGIQDYECFLLFENMTKELKDSLGSRASWIDPKRRSKELAGRVVMSIQEHSDEPQVLYKARKQLFSEMTGFNTSPRVYFQTNPMENSTVTKNSSVEVMGWTEPGTKILINGREIPVNAQGYFLEQFGGNLIDTTKIPITKGSIRIHASNGNGTKEIVRDFNIR